jgi:hypothetical protein
MSQELVGEPTQIMRRYLAMRLPTVPFDLPDMAVLTHTRVRLTADSGRIFEHVDGSGAHGWSVSSLIKML